MSRVTDEEEKRKKKARFFEIVGETRPTIPAEMYRDISHCVEHASFENDASLALFITGVGSARSARNGGKRRKAFVCVSIYDALR